MDRKAEPRDCGAIYDLICDMEHRALPFEPFREIFLAQLQSEAFYCFVREEEGSVRGVLNLRFERQLHHAERIAEIMEFAVAPACRRRGVGREMLAEACRIASGRGCTQIEVACNRLRKDTHRFYLREGMHDFHFKFSRSLTGNDSGENALGR